MSNIWITDNHIPIALDATDKGYRHDLITDKAKTDLEKIAKYKIGDKFDGKHNVLVFPRDIRDCKDKILDERIISINGTQISTNNIMGFVGVNDTQLDIKSRFAQDGGRDYFLHYMLQKVFAINLFDIPHTSNQEQIFDFLLYLFPYYLKKALAQGLFKKYRTFERNDANIRGTIDVSRHIRQNIPFRGTVAYTTREHTYDNELTQLVRHTIEFIRGKEQGHAILSNDDSTKIAVSQIVMATPSYNVRERQHIINQNLRPIQHPYFAAYTDLQKICLQILRHESLKYGQEKDQIYGILFDGAWLWEEYLNTIFERHHLNIIHAKNKTGENGIALYEKGKKCYYPDFYRDDKEGDKSLVLDAKYKRLGYDVKYDGDETPASNKISIGHDDLFQMITYMYVLSAKRCALLYPIEPKERTNQDEGNDCVIRSKSRKLNGYKGEILGFGLKIPVKNEMKEFWNGMRDVEEGLVKKVDDVFQERPSESTSSPQHS